MNSKLVFQLQAIDNASGTIAEVSNKLKSIQDKKNIEVQTRVTALMMPAKLIKEGMKSQEKGLAAGESGLAKIAAQRQKEQQKYESTATTKGQQYDVARKQGQELKAKEQSILAEQNNSLAEIASKKQALLKKQSDINAVESAGLAEISAKKQSLAAKQQSNAAALNNTLAQIASQQQAKEQQLLAKKLQQENSLAQENALQTNKMIALIDKQRKEKLKLDKEAAAASRTGNSAELSATRKRQQELASRHERERENRKIADSRAIDKIQRQIQQTEKQVESSKRAAAQQQQAAQNAHNKTLKQIEAKENSIISQENQIKKQYQKQKQMILNQQSKINSQEQKAANQYNKQLDSVRKNIAANQNKQARIYDESMSLFEQHSKRASELDEAERKIQEGLARIDTSAPELTFLDKLELGFKKASKYISEGSAPYLEMTKKVFSGLVSLYGAYFKVGQMIVSFTGTIISFGVTLVSTLTRAFASIVRTLASVISFIGEMGQSFETLNFSLGAMILSNENLEVSAEVSGRKLDKISSSLAYANELYGDMVVMAAKLPGTAEDFMDIFTTSFASAKRVGMMPKPFLELSAKIGAIAIVLGNTSKNAANSLNQMLQGTVTKQNVLNNKFLTTLGMQTAQFNKLKPDERLKKVQEIVEKFAPGLQAYQNSYEALLSTMQTHMKEITRMGTMPLFIHLKRIMREINAFFDEASPMIKDVFREMSYDILDMLVPAEMAFKYILSNWKYYLAVLIEKAHAFAQQNSELFSYVPVVLDMIGKALTRLFKMLASFSGVKPPKKSDMPKVEVQMDPRLAAWISAQKALKFGKDVLSGSKEGDYRSVYNPAKPLQLKPFYEQMSMLDPEYYAQLYRPGTAKEAAVGTLAPQGLASPAALMMGKGLGSVMGIFGGAASMLAGNSIDAGNSLGGVADAATKAAISATKASKMFEIIAPPKQAPIAKTELEQETEKHLPQGIMGGIAKGMIAPLELGPIAIHLRNAAGGMAALGAGMVGLWAILPGVAGGLLSLGGGIGASLAASMQFAAFLHPVSAALLILSVGFANMLHYPEMVALSLKYLGQIIDNIVGALADFASIFDPIADALGYLFAAIMPPIAAFVDAFFGIVRAIVAIVKAVLTPIIRFAMGLLKILFGLFGVIAAIIAAIAKFVELLAWGIVWLVDAVAKMPIIKDVIDFISWLGGKLADFGKALLGVIVDIVSVFDDAIDYIKKLLNMAPTKEEDKWSVKVGGGADFREVLGAKTDITGKGPVINQDFSGSKFEINQKFEEGFDPDRVAVAFIGQLGKLGEKKIQSGFAPLYSPR